MTTQKNQFTELAKINVNDHVEKKGRFSYLSWPWAIEQISKFDPTSTWEVVRFDGMPYLKTECGYFVEVAVTVKGVTRSQIHPVLDNRNQPIAKPSAFEINTSIQRGLVKAIALHGLGLYIYAGEDLPVEDSADIEQRFESCQTEADLIKVWSGLSKEQHQKYVAIKDAKKQALQKAA